MMTTDLIEDIIAGLWCEILSVPHANPDDDFFFLGGDSLGALKLANRVKATTGVTVSLRDFFDRSTFHGLVNIVHRRSAEGVTIGFLPSLGTGVTCQRAALPQEALWRQLELHPDDTSGVLPLCFELSGRVDAEALNASIRLLIHRHEALRTTFHPIDGELRMVVQPEDAVDSQILVERQVVSSESPTAIAECIENTPFNVSEGPMIRAILVRGPDRDHLILAYHHISVDGHSIAILHNELSAIYNSLMSGQKPVLAPLPFGYSAYVAWQHERLRRGDFDQALAFWRERLDGARLLGVFADVDSYEALAGTPPTVVSVVVDPALTAHLRSVARRLRATPYLVCAAQLRLLLADVAGYDDVVFGGPVVNRSTAGFESIVGYFRNVLINRVGPHLGVGIEEEVVNVRTAAVTAYPYQECPFALVSQRVLPRPPQTGLPQWEVGIAMQPSPSREIRFGDVVARNVELRLKGIKWPLTVNLYEDSDEIAVTFVYQPRVLKAPDRVAELPERFISSLRRITA